MSWTRSPGVFWGTVLVVVGGLILLANTGVLGSLDWNIAWPVALILVGVVLLGARYVPGGGASSLDSAEPVAGLSSAALDVAAGAGRINVAAAPLGDQLYRAHVAYAGTAPVVALDRAAGTVRLRQRFDWTFGARRLEVDTQINDAIPWALTCATGAIHGTFDLAAARLSRFELRTGASRVDVTLGPPQGQVPVRIDGGALTVMLTRPAGAAIRVAVSGGAVKLAADGSHQDGIGSREWRSAGFDAATDRYDVSISGGAADVTVSERQA